MKIIIAVLGLMAIAHAYAMPHYGYGNRGVPNDGRYHNRAPGYANPVPHYVRGNSGVETVEQYHNQGPGYAHSGYRLTDGTVREDKIRHNLASNGKLTQTATGYAAIPHPGGGRSQTNYYADETGNHAGFKYDSGIRPQFGHGHH